MRSGVAPPVRRRRNMGLDAPHLMRQLSGTHGESSVAESDAISRMRLISTIIFFGIVASVRNFVLADPTLPLESLLPLACFFLPSMFDLARTQIKLTTFEAIFYTAASALATKDLDAPVRDYLAYVLVLGFLLHPKSIKSWLFFAFLAGLGIINYRAASALYDPKHQTALAVNRSDTVMMNSGGDPLLGSTVLSSMAMLESRGWFWFLMTNLCIGIQGAYYLKEGSLLSAPRSALTTATAQAWRRVLKVWNAFLLLRAVSSAVSILFVRPVAAVLRLLALKWVMGAALWFFLMMVEWNSHVSLGAITISTALAIRFWTLFVDQKYVRTQITFIGLGMLFNTVVYLIVPRKALPFLANSVISAYFILILAFLKSPSTRKDSSANGGTGAEKEASSPASKPLPEIYSDSSTVLLVLAWIATLAFDYAHQATANWPIPSLVRTTLSLTTIGYGLLMLVSIFFDLVEQQLRLHSASNLALAADQSALTGTSKETASVAEAQQTTKVVLSVKKNDAKNSSQHESDAKRSTPVVAKTEGAYSAHRTASREDGGEVAAPSSTSATDEQSSEGQQYEELEEPEEGLQTSGLSAAASSHPMESGVETPSTTGDATPSTPPNESLTPGSSVSGMPAGKQARKTKADIERERKLWQEAQLQSVLQEDEEAAKRRNAKKQRQEDRKRQAQEQRAADQAAQALRLQRERELKEQLETERRERERKAQEERLKKQNERERQEAARVAKEEAERKQREADLRKKEREVAVTKEREAKVQKEKERKERDAKVEKERKEKEAAELLKEKQQLREEKQQQPATQAKKDSKAKQELPPEPKKSAAANPSTPKKKDTPKSSPVDQTEGGKKTATHVSTPTTSSAGKHEAPPLVIPKPKSSQLREQQQKAAAAASSTATSGTAAAASPVAAPPVLSSSDSSMVVESAGGDSIVLSPKSRAAPPTAICSVDSEKQGAGAKKGEAQQGQSPLPGVGRSESAANVISSSNVSVIGSSRPQSTLASPLFPSSAVAMLPTTLVDPTADATAASQQPPQALVGAADTKSPGTVVSTGSFGSNPPIQDRISGWMAALTGPTGSQPDFGSGSGYADAFAQPSGTTPREGTSLLPPQVAAPQQVTPPVTAAAAPGALPPLSPSFLGGTGQETKPAAPTGPVGGADGGVGAGDTEFDTLWADIRNLRTLDDDGSSTVSAPVFPGPPSHVDRQSETNSPGRQSSGSTPFATHANVSPQSGAPPATSLLGVHGVQTQYVPQSQPLLQTVPSPTRAGAPANPAMNVQVQQSQPAVGAPGAADSPGYFQLVQLPGTSAGEAPQYAYIHYPTPVQSPQQQPQGQQTYAPPAVQPTSFAPQVQQQQQQPLYYQGQNGEYYVVLPQQQQPQ